MSNFTTARGQYFTAKRAGKPQKAAQALTAAILAGTTAEVDEFIRDIRKSAGVQDLAMLPQDMNWTVTELGSQKVVNVVSTAELVDMLAGAANVAIDWPSVTFHWGTLVSFEIRGGRFNARTSDWQLTETYLSS